MEKKNKIEKKSKYVIRPCSCGCCMLVVEKTIWEDGEYFYNISIQDSRYDRNYNTLLGRIKRAIKVLFGKPIYYNDLLFEDEKDFSDFLRESSELIDFNYGRVKKNV